MATIIKAVLAAAIAAASSIATGLGDNILSGQEIVTAVVAGLLALGVVYQIPNKNSGV